MQCKDIADLPILEFVAKHGGIGCHWFTSADQEWQLRSVRNAMPDLPTEKLALAKMRQLMKRGLVDGCDCGCRGDFELTDKGRAYLDAYRDPGS